MTLIAISLVCSLWRSLVQPLFYRKIQIFFGHGGSLSTPSESLLDHLRKVDYLYDYVLNLSVTCYAEIDTRMGQKLVGILRTMPHLKTLCLNLRDEQVLSPDLFDQIRSMTSIDRLISGSSFDVLEIVAHMTVDSRDSYNLFTEMEVTCPTSFLSEYPCLKLQNWLWKLESLHIRPHSHPEALYEMLKWLQALRRIHFGPLIGFCMYEDEYTTSTIQDLLDLHAHRLERIELPGYSHDDVGILPDFGNFTTLTYLQMSQQELFQSDPEVAVDKLCAPCISILHINMAMEISEPYEVEDFEQRHADWIVRFATYYRQSNSSGSLRGIHVDYDWSSGENWQSSSMDTPWPNDRLEALRPLIRDLGMNLTWPKPSWNKEDWCGQKRRDLINSKRTWMDWMNENVRGRY